MPIPAGSALLLSVDEFALLLENPSIDVDRASRILGWAQKLCETIVSPLPDSAEMVIFDVAARAFANPAPSRSQSFSLYTEGQGPFGEVTPGTSGGGLYLMKGEKQRLRELRDLASGGTSTRGAFSIDMLPATLPGLPPWDTGDDLATLLDLP